jgi:hypothetical protein
MDFDLQLRVMLGESLFDSPPQFVVDVVVKVQTASHRARQSEREAPLKYKPTAIDEQSDDGELPCSA